MDIYTEINEAISAIPSKVNYNIYNDNFSILDYISLTIIIYTTYIILHHIVFVVLYNERMKINRLNKDKNISGWILILAFIIVLTIALLLGSLTNIKDKYNILKDTTLNIIERKNTGNILYLNFDIRYLYDTSILLFKNVKLSIVFILKNFNLLSLKLNYIFIFINIMLYIAYIIVYNNYYNNS